MVTHGYEFVCGQWLTECIKGRCCALADACTLLSAILVYVMHLPLTAVNWLLYASRHREEISPIAHLTDAPIFRQVTRAANWVLNWGALLLLIISARQIQLWCWQCAPYKCMYYYFFCAHQHKAAGVKTKQKQRLRRLLIRCSLCWGRRPHSPAVI